MRAVVVYESVFGNTHHVADAIGAGLATSHEVEVLTPEEATGERVVGADLVVVGGPTHVHGMARTSTKASGVAGEEAHVEKGEPAHDLDEQATGETLRDWFGDLARLPDQAVAAFDTRVEGPAAITGRASKGIAKRLRHHGASLVVEPESFLVDKENELVDGELERARRWGADLAAAVAAGA